MRQAGPWPPLLAVSLAAWAALAGGGEWLFLPGYCAASADLLGAGLGGLRAALRFNPVHGLAAGWLLMLAAMMPPLLAAPLAHVWERSFARRRPRAIGLFLLGYAGVWTAAGLLLLPAAVALHFVAGGGPLAAGAAIAFLWQFSPGKQRCLNRCHRLPPLAAFGIEAERDALGFGLRHGFWCVGACWAAMLLPLMAKDGHAAAMLLAAAFLLAERVERPDRAGWRLRWPRRGFAVGMVLLRRGLPGP